MHNPITSNVLEVFKYPCFTDDGTIDSGYQTQLGVVGNSNAPFQAASQGQGVATRPSIPNFENPQYAER